MWPYDLIHIQKPSLYKCLPESTGSIIPLLHCTKNSPDLLILSFPPYVFPSSESLWRLWREKRGLEMQGLSGGWWEKGLINLKWHSGRVWAWVRALEWKAVGVCSAWKHGTNLRPSSFERLTSAHGNVEVDKGGQQGGTQVPEIHDDLKSENCSMAVC